MSTPDAVFAGSVPANYDRHMGPLFFEPFARDVARRLSGLREGAVLETAAGTGIVTAALVDTLPPAVAITATDLNQPMLDHAMGKPGLERVAFRQADAQALPFDDATFDAVVCQFGAMFFPDRVAAYREARRVLRPAGRFLFSTWDRVDHAPVAHAALRALSRLFTPAGSWFLERTPHGHFDAGAIERDLRAAGWETIEVERVTQIGRAASARSAAVALCQGTPMRAEIEAFGPDALAVATDAVAAEIAARFGDGPFEAPSRALVMEVAR
ncbi:methyltransferase domain-containing protein [Roseomonas sp. JC162]|uniref:Methyltransferase domain-containing protein n=1 Tax=Neoroseomonas marina TaxID=1232220 RepID=A0A848EJP6_9PROT|nr:methyltransferase domain-containing protein [Neoroseomonas marina]NMJ43623.1 methyltransferase domain-containing protein [Neoroseomonas marina]